jgi:Sulfite exporter TauE/SafE
MQYRPTGRTQGGVRIADGGVSALAVRHHRRSSCSGLAACPVVRHRAGLGLERVRTCEAAHSSVCRHRRGACRQDGSGRAVGIHRRAPQRTSRSAVARDRGRACVGGWRGRWKVEHARAVALLFPIKQAIGAGALFNLVIALPAAAFFPTHDHGTPGRPLDALGDVALFCVAALSLPALFVAPLAARWSARAPVSLLRRLFALCLAVIAVRLLLRP